MRDRIKELRRVPASELVQNEANWRRHPERQRQALRAVLQEVGIADAAIAYEDADGRLVLIDGHLRRDELETVPVLVLDVNANEADILLGTLDPLAGMAAADTDALRALVDRIDAGDAVGQLLAELAGEKPTVPPEAIETPEPPRKPKAKPGDVFHLGRHRLLCGDSTGYEAVARFVGEPVTLTVTSPPYGVGVDYGELVDDTLDNVRAILARLPSVLWELTDGGGFAVVNFGDIVSARAELGDVEPSEYPMAVEYWPAFRSVGWILNTRRIWAKPHARVAAPWCASSNRAASDWEHLWTWHKPGGGLNVRRNESYLGVWDTSREEGVEVGKDVHGAGMALAVALRSIRIYSEQDGHVFEPFCGTGTTLIAAELTGRTCSAVELEPRFVDVTVKRWENLTGHKAEKERRR